MDGSQADRARGVDPEGNMLQAALRYAARGLHVFPLEPRGKRPLTPNGFKDASIAEATIRDWWKRWQDANIGVACGASGLVVIDADAKSGGLESWAELKGRLGISDETVTALTGGGGQHLIYRNPEGLEIRSSAGTLGPGLDVRASGGYFVAPPSIHPDGKSYTWEIGYGPEERDVAVLPQALIDLLTSGQEARAPVVPERIVEGQRNEMFASLAGSMRRRGMSEEAIEAALVAENAGRCDPPLPEDEVKAIARSVARYPAAEHGAEQTPEDQPPDACESAKPGAQADRLIALVEEEGLELFRDEVGDAFARVPVHGGLETLRCRGKDFRRWLAGRFWQKERKAPNSDALNSALTVLEAKARFDGAEHRLNNRVACHEEAIWYDLVDVAWRAIRVTPTDWEIVADPPILFRRYAHQQAQVEPSRGGDLHDLLRFVNLQDPSQRLLLLVYAVSCLVPDIPHPIPELHGPQGAAKTTQFRMLRRLIDPSAIEVLSIPRDTAELVQQLSHHWMPLYDNVSGMPGWVSDTLCRAVTGEGFSKRELYSDDDDVIYRFRRCVGLNGMNVAATKPDLLDRCLLFCLEPIAPDQRKPERELWEEFERARPGLVGAALDAVSTAMSLLPTVRLRGLPRMADFARWGCAIARALGHTEPDFMAAYGDNIKEQNDEVLHSNPVAAVVAGFMDATEHWEGTSTQLLDELGQVAERQKVDVRSRSWPKAAHSLTRRLNEVRHNLAAAGITVTVDRSGGHRSVRLQKVAENTVIGVTTVQKSLEALETAQERDATAAPRDEASQIASPAGPPTSAPDGPGDASDANDASSAAHSGKAGPSSLPEGADKAVRDYAEMLVEDGMTPEEAERRAWEWAERGFPADG
jgi:hypothetical protein